MLARTPEEERLTQRAHYLANRALKAGKIKRTPCTHCGKRQDSVPPNKRSNAFHMHHEDYMLPYQITWLCARCHRQRHRSPPLASPTHKTRPQAKMDTFDEQYRMFARGRKHQNT